MERKNIQLIMIGLLVLALTVQTYRAAIYHEAYDEVSDEWHGMTILADQAIYLAKTCNDGVMPELGWQERIEQSHNERFGLT